MRRPPRQRRRTYAHAAIRIHLPLSVTLRITADVLAEVWRTIRAAAHEADVRPYQRYPNEDHTMDPDLLVLLEELRVLADLVADAAPGAQLDPGATRDVRERLRRLLPDLRGVAEAIGEAVDVVPA